MNGKEHATGNILIMLDKLPPFIQKGKFLCRLNITKQGNHYLISYTNAKDDYFVFGGDIEDVLQRMLEKLRNPPSKKYSIDLNWHSNEY